MSTSDTDDLLAERYGIRRGPRPRWMVPVVAAGGVCRVRALGTDHATVGELRIDGQVDVPPGTTYVEATLTASWRAVVTGVYGCKYTGA